MKRGAGKYVAHGEVSLTTVYTRCSAEVRQVAAPHLPCRNSFMTPDNTMSLIVAVTVGVVGD